METETNKEMEEKHTKEILGENKVLYISFTF